MSSGKTTIELNGKRYDTATGRVLDAPVSTEHKQITPLHIATKKKTSGIHIDGFVRAAAKNTVSNAAASTTLLPKPPFVKKEVIRSVKPINHHAAQKAHTLMRSAVKKPQTTPIKAMTTPLQPSTFTHLEDKSPSTHKSFSKRTTRADNIHKSSLISRFGDQQETVIKKVQPVSVTPAPVHHAIKHQPAPHAPVHRASPSHPAVHHVATKSEALFAKALETASSHQQKPTKKARTHHKVAKRLGTSTRVVTASSAVLSVLLLTGFFAYQNVPNFAMRIAATRAGFHASMPSYKPAGFAMQGPISYSTGQVTVNFKSTTDDRSFKITQQPSNWNSETLLDQHVAAGRRPYQTYQDNGKTVYIYDGTNATWVDGGVWYQIEGSASLNNDQLLKVASSL